MRRQRLAAVFDGPRIDQDKGDYAGRARSVDPVVDRAALDQHVTRAQGDDLGVELHIDLAGQHHGIVDGIRAVIARRDARSVFDDPEDGAVVARRGGDFLGAVRPAGARLGRPKGPLERPCTLFTSSGNRLRTDLELVSRR